MSDVDHAIETLVRLKNLGLHLAIDDFGTGHSSLSYLRRFPIDLVKIDRSFISDIPESPDDIAIVSAVIAMAHNLNIRVLAEGVQNVEQMEFLRAHRCDELQGYLLGHPLPAGDFRTFAENLATSDCEPRKTACHQ
jgi:EAL domain-containing protein (putative c-di-GMP-specific phosphodiesterase class I)